MNKISTVFAALILSVTVSSNTAIAEGNVEAGRIMANTVCATCHGLNGLSPILNTYPKIAHQRPEYFESALRDYKSGARNNSIMKPFATMLTDQDIANLAAYYEAPPLR